MKICFLARPSYDRYSIAILKTLREKYDNKIEGYFITSNQKESNYVLNNIGNITVYETSKYIKEHWDEFTEEKFFEYEKKYECEPIWKYIYTDRFLVNRDYDYVMRITVGLFSFFESIFEKSDINFYYSETIATLQCYIAYLVGKKYGVKYLAQMCARGSLDSEYHYFIEEEFQYNMNFNSDYKTEKYTHEEWEYAEKYLSEFEEKDCPPPAMKLVETRPRISIYFIAAPIMYFWKRFSREMTDPYSYMYYQGYKLYMDPIKNFFNYRRAKKYYKKARFDRKYIYFPLHYQPEASTCVCAQKYEKQLFFIDSWAKSLPADTVMYVKEHYALLGNRDPQFYVELQKYPNVFLIDPWENSRKLIENSIAVTTLTGTAGFEAMLLRKPVFLGGNIVFDNAPGIIKVDDIYQNYLPEIKKWKQPSRKEVIQYLCACFRSYKKGNAYAQNYYHLIEENIDNICEALYEQMMKLI